MSAHVLMDQHAKRRRKLSRGRVWAPHLSTLSVDFGRLNIQMSFEYYNGARRWEIAKLTKKSVWLKLIGQAQKNCIFKKRTSQTVFFFLFVFLFAQWKQRSVTHEIFLTRKSWIRLRTTCQARNRIKNSLLVCAWWVSDHRGQEDVVGVVVKEKRPQQRRKCHISVEAPLLLLPRS